MTSKDKSIVSSSAVIPEWADKHARSLGYASASRFRLEDPEDVYREDMHVGLEFPSVNPEWRGAIVMIDRENGYVDVGFAQ